MLPKPLLFVLALVTAPVAADTLFHNARILTLDPEQPVAAALHVDAAGRIVAVHATFDARGAKSAKNLVDLGGAVVVPGLIDGHGHLLNLGLSLMIADLQASDSQQEIIERLQRFEAGLPPGAWLLGRGWDQNRWSQPHFPTAADLDAAFPDRPVWLQRVDGHAAWANSAALSRVTTDLDGDWQPDGGRILRDDQGRATGVFIDRAMALVEQVRPAVDRDSHRQALQRALATAASLGLTGVHDAGVDLDTLGLLRELADAGELPIRVYAMADGDGPALDWLCEHGAYAHPGGRLQMRAVKLYMDGALGSRGAALLADYRDDPGNRGLLATPQERIEAAIEKAVRCGIQANTHAIGDRGNRIVLDAYERLVPDKERSERRFRIEHAQIVASEDLDRFAALDVIASMQPIHATSDMPWAAARVGRERLHGAYAWQRLLDSGAHLAFGSDFPVEPVNPWFGLHAAVTRQDAQGRPAGGWLPDQRLDIETALRAHTLGAAYAGFAEHEVGALTPRRRADFVVIDVDPLQVDALSLRAAQVLATYVDGTRVHPQVDR